MANASRRLPSVKAQDGNGSESCITIRLSNLPLIGVSLTPSCQSIDTALDVADGDEHNQTANIS